MSIGGRKKLAKVSGMCRFQDAVLAKNDGQTECSTNMFFKFFFIGPFADKLCLSKQDSEQPIWSDRAALETIALYLELFCVVDCAREPYLLAHQTTVG